MSRKFSTNNQQPPAGFNQTRKIDKAAYVLKGIIDGVNVDGNLVDTEILYLDAWMRGQQSLGLQVVAFDLYQAVNRVLEDRNMSLEVCTDLNELIQSILDFGDENRTPEDKARICEFLSMLKAICANGIIIQPEIHGVNAWITANRDISKAIPIKPVYHRIQAAVKENVVDGKDVTKLDELVTETTSDPCSPKGDVVQLKRVCAK